jgi:hypothetical protein
MKSNNYKDIFYLYIIFILLVLLAGCKKTERVVNKSGVVPSLRMEQVPLIQSTQLRGKRDKVPPVVSITSPSGTVNGTVDVLVNATDNIGIREVELYVNDVKVSTSLFSPYTNSLNTGSYSNGNYTIKVIAYDLYGNQATDSKVITIANGYNDVISPVVTLNVNSSYQIGESVYITSAATDNIGVTKVEIYINNQLVKVGNSYVFDPVSTGSYVITVKAYDNALNVGIASKQIGISITYIPIGDLPGSVRLTMPEAQHQGGEGSCVAFTLMYARSSIYYTTNSSLVLFSPEFIFNQITVDQYCNGSALLTGLELLMTKGVCTWATMPYTSSGCTTQPNQIQLDEALNYKIRSYSRIGKTDWQAIKTMLVNKNPLVIQATIDDNFRNATGSYIWNSFSTNAGLHSLVICGYDDSKNAYLALNSWGTSYCENGYVWIDYDFFSTISSDLFILNL